MFLNGRIEIMLSNGFKILMKLFLLLFFLEYLGFRTNRKMMESKFKEKKSVGLVHLDIIWMI